MRPADKLQIKANFLPLVGLVRSKQKPINHGHGAQYLYRPPPAGAASTIASENIKGSGRTSCQCMFMLSTQLVQHLFQDN